MIRLNLPAAAMLAGLISLSTGLAPAQAQGAAGQKAAADEPAPKFDKAYLSNPANIKVGEGVWQNQCRHCHGKSAYPGKAPKLNPGSLEPEFIFDRVANGFRQMPAWKGVFKPEELKAVVAYVKSDSFSP